MKPNTKIRADKHGLYIRTDGGVYRPVPTFDHRQWKTRSVFVEGDPVKVWHPAQTTYAKVAAPDGRLDYWPLHGSSFRFVDGQYKLRDTEEAWNPL